MVWAIGRDLVALDSEINVVVVTSLERDGRSAENGPVVEYGTCQCGDLV